MRRILRSSIYALALTVATAAIARDNEGEKNRNAQLKGQYALNGTVSCIVSGTPFNPNFTPTSFTVFTRATLVGVQTFTGNGTGTFKARSVGLNPPPVTNNATTPPTTPLGGISAGASDAVGEFAYSIDSEGLLSIDLVPGTFLQVTNTSGPGAGSSFIVDHHQLAGMISRDKKTIVLATTEPLMETQTVTPVVGPAFNRYRVCHRWHVLTWIGE